MKWGLSIGIFCILFLSQIGYSQTKIIALKSHSGSMIELNFNDEDNYGMAPQRRVKFANLDSVIYLNDSLAIMVTSEVCTLSPKYSKEDSEKQLWKQGKDTVKNHPLFSLQHDLDSIKRGLELYYFNKPVNEIVFMGCDNLKNVKDGQNNNNQHFYAIFKDWNPPLWGALFLLILSFILFFKLSLKENNL